MKAERNPLMGLPSMARLLARPEAERLALAALLMDMAHQANANAENAWKKRKGPMAAYWRAASTYAKHVARALRRKQTALQIVRAAA